MAPGEAQAPGPTQTGIFEAPPGPVHAGSPPATKVAFFASLFAARRDVYAVRWENNRTGRSGWMPAVEGGWRKGAAAKDRSYLPLTEEVLTAHLSGDTAIGLYPLLDADRCHWLAADFDGQAAMLDALAYLKAARAQAVTAALEVSRSGLDTSAVVDPQTCGFNAESAVLRTPTSPLFHMECAPVPVLLRRDPHR